MVPTDNVGFVREFQNSVYGDDGYENVHPGSPTELDLSGRFVVYGKVNYIKRDGYVDPNELKASRSSASSELFDNPLYEVVEESSSSIEMRLREEWTRGSCRVKTKKKQTKQLCRGVIW